jgi:predicted O-methyltransferase YrrM
MEKEAQRPGRSEATTDVWRGEPELHEERSRRHRDDPPWHSWNRMSPEHEFCEFVAALVRMAKPRSVIETGVGQGFTTRRAAAALAPGATLKGFESDPAWRKKLAALDFFDDEKLTLAAEPTPSDDELAAVDLLVADSAQKYRPAEVTRWSQRAKPGSLIVVHDTGNGHPDWTPHHRMSELIESLEISGVRLPNPRGSFVGQR